MEFFLFFRVILASCCSTRNHPDTGLFIQLPANCRELHCTVTSDTPPVTPQNPSPLSESSNSSSLMSSTTTSVLPGMATLTTFTGGKDTTILEVGNPTASLFDKFCDAALIFFHKHKIIDGHNKVCSILNYFHDPHIDSWIKNNKLHINEDT